jgi:hypothetical protein
MSKALRRNEVEHWSFRLVSCFACRYGYFYRLVVVRCTGRLVNPDAKSKFPGVTKHLTGDEKHVGG